MRWSYCNSAWPPEIIVWGVGRLQGRHGQIWHARPPQWRPHQQRAAAASATFYSAKSRQGLGHWGIASRGSPGLTYKMTDLCLLVYKQTSPFINGLFF